ncbi:zinc dependent phospholipase C family protein [Haloplasma contractile]|uniref:Zinc dependent phospholipase C protein n=1 Tax=Haloplasma contractile SSD-17B TaxID=1033810 RepID=U2DUN7_9MOLU|nr:zinc dependent phospholipase C family protein [Haloplasma contractile]ERJ12122.1 Zinc dependent phospholipase C protein [Haloplasma contractile SSD-17B]
MASWMTHIRIAEKLLTKYQFDKESFLVGNIAPDSGASDGNSGFIPPKEVTHWKNKNVSSIMYDQINPDAFYETYLDSKEYSDPKHHTFLIGYYIHLLIDIYWHQLIMNKKLCNPIICEEIESNQADFRNELKMLDFLYLMQEATIYETVFTQIVHGTDYLDYFPKGAITNHLKKIKEFYNEPLTIKESYKYVSNEEMSRFIESCTKRLERKIDDLLSNCNSYL